MRRLGAFYWLERRFEWLDYVTHAVSYLLLLRLQVTLAHCHLATANASLPVTDQLFCRLLLLFSLVAGGSFQAEATDESRAILVELFDELVSRLSLRSFIFVRYSAHLEFALRLAFQVGALHKSSL